MLKFIWSRLTGSGWADLADTVATPTPHHRQGTLFGEYPDLPATRLAYQS